jgi:hypothetical protein
MLGAVYNRAIHLDLTEEERFVLLNLLTETIEAARHPQSPRIRTLRRILDKFRPIGSIGRPLGAVERDIRPLLGATPQTSRVLTRRQSQNNTMGPGRLNPPA